MLKKSLLAAVVALTCTGCSSVANLNYNPTPEAKLGKWKSDSPISYPVQSTDQFKHVLVVVLENESKTEAESAEYLAKIKREGAYFENFHGIVHPSYSNYLAMISGRLFESHFDFQINKNTMTIAELLKSKGLEWRNYAEGYPGSQLVCFTSDGLVDAHYVRKHVPFLSFERIQQEDCKTHIAPISVASNCNPQGEHCADEGKQSAGLFLHDWQSLVKKPAYTFYSPDTKHDGHDTGVQAASLWLSGFLESVRANAEFMQDTLIVVTFDESDQTDKNNENRIYTVFLGGNVTPGSVQSDYNHFNVLRTVEENFGLAPVGDKDEVAKPITGIWKKP